MPQYTTSYSTHKKRPTYRHAPVGQRLPSSARRRAKKPGATYLHHTQGFGRSNRRRNMRPNKRNPYAFIAVGCAFLLFVAAVIGYTNRTVDVELNGSTVQVRINSTIEQLIDSQNIEVRAGNLLAVDDSVLTKRGGEKISVKLGKKQIETSKLSSIKLTGGEKLTVANGRDTYEEHDIKATTIQPTISFEGSGAIQYVKTWGEAGRSEVWTGKTSGKTQDRGAVKKPVNAVVACASVKPKSGKYVALTFNGAPSKYTDQILEVLKEKGVTATFFLSSDSTSTYAGQARAIADAGCEVGLYASLGDKTGDSLRNALTKGLDAVSSATGTKTALVRSADGRMSEEQWATTMDLMGAAVSWSFDSGDWLRPGVDSVVETVTGSVSNGNIVSMTDNDETSAQTVEALPQIIDRLLADGYKFVTLDDLIVTDKDLKGAIDLSQASMPKGATLPALPAQSDDDAGATTE